MKQLDSVRLHTFQGPQSEELSILGCGELSVCDLRREKEITFCPLKAMKYSGGIQPVSLSVHSNPVRAP